MPRVQPHPGHDLFTVLAARHANHLHIGHRRVGEEELLQLARVDVLAAANDHVLAAPDNTHIALLVHHRQVAGVHPAFLIDAFGRGLGVVPVAQHHAVTPRAQLADLATRHAVAIGIDHLVLQPRLGAPDAGHAALQVVAGAGLQRHRAGFGHAIGNLHLGHVHLADNPAHHFDRAGGTGHDPGAQARQVELAALGVVQFGDEHGRHTIQRRGLFFRHRTQGGQRVEGVVGVDQGAAVGHAAEVGHYHAKAVVQRHRHHQPVMLGQAQAFTDHVAVVEDVAVAEGGAFRETGGA
ncbi:hypothetical protein D3C76_1124410 [compost metagenome]